MNFVTTMLKLVASPGIDRDELEAIKAGIEAMAGDTRCPCGHAVDSDLRCLNGRIYGPCASERCDGPCTDTYGDCDADICLCEEDQGD